MTVSIVTRPAIRRRLPRRIGAQHLVGDEKRVEAIGDEVDACRRHDQPRGIDGLAPSQRDDSERNRAQHDDTSPYQLVHGRGHGFSP